MTLCRTVQILGLCHLTCGIHVRGHQEPAETEPPSFADVLLAALADEEREQTDLPFLSSFALQPTGAEPCSCDDAFAAMDTSGDSKISRGEAYAFAARHLLSHGTVAHRMVWKVFNDADANRDHYLSDYEFCRLRTEFLSAHSVPAEAAEAAVPSGGIWCHMKSATVSALWAIPSGASSENSSAARTPLAKTPPVKTASAARVEAKRVNFEVLFEDPEALDKIEERLEVALTARAIKSNELSDTESMLFYDREGKEVQEGHMEELANMFFPVTLKVSVLVNQATASKGTVAATYGKTGKATAIKKMTTTSTITTTKAATTIVKKTTATTTSTTTLPVEFSFADVLMAAVRDDKLKQASSDDSMGHTIGFEAMKYEFNNCDDAFAGMDGTGDDKISINDALQFAANREVHGHIGLHKVVYKTFKAADTNHDKYLSIQEFCEAGDKMRSLVGRHSA